MSIDTTHAPATEPTPQAGRPATPCTTYPWCTATGDHDRHTSAREVLNGVADPVGGFITHFVESYLFDADGAGDVRGVLIGGDHLELTGDQMRERASELHAFANQVTALAAQLDASRRADTPAETEAHTWTLTVDGGTSITGYRPAWAKNDPSRDVTAERIGAVLSDLGMYRYYDGSAGVPVFHAADGDQPAGPLGLPMLRAVMNVHPYREAAQQQPTVDVEVLGDSDEWMENLTPEQLADVIATVRAQCDRLDQVHTDLIAARADWEANAR
ncbi:hypothetical protein [Streptomyces sp. NBRC 109706]|uniref:DUF6907 domain-containing protein n=1 Tax=Streptomyces sp. NBRC 109706 TaxID=1550035 RepID=UPI0007805D49|nr:hypothetical protein [Streptomyces sp. NBRC 109706]